MAVDAKYSIVGEILKGLYNVQYRNNPCQGVSIDVVKSYVDRLNCTDPDTEELVAVEYCGDYECEVVSEETTSHFLLKKLSYTIPTPAIPEYDVFFYVAPTDIIRGKAPYTYLWSFSCVGDKLDVIGGLTNSTLKLKAKTGQVFADIDITVTLVITSDNFFTTTKSLQTILATSTKTIACSIPVDQVPLGKLVYGATENDANGILNVSVLNGGGVTIDFVVNDPLLYKVHTLIVDGVAVSVPGSSYTFTNVTSNHTIALTFKTIVDVDFLERSDLPDTTYSTLHTALAAVKTSYPLGLTQDVVISCVGLNIEEHINLADPDKSTADRIYFSLLKEWNQGSVYTLTIDGGNEYTINCGSYGGPRFEGVDNIIFKNCNIVNFAHTDAVPEELGGLFFIGSQARAARNLYVANCQFDGREAEVDSTGAYRGIISKFSQNIYFLGNEIKGISGLGFILSQVSLFSFIKNTFSGFEIQGNIGHPGVALINGAEAVFIEDNDFNMLSFTETMFYVSNCSRVHLKRNKIYDGERILDISSNTSMIDLSIESNLISGMLNAPIYAWIKELVYITCDITLFRFIHNTVIQNGAWAYQFGVRSPETVTFDTLINSNNIFNNKMDFSLCCAFSIGKINTYQNVGNTYKALLYIGSTVRFQNFQMMQTATDSPVLVDSSISRNMTDMQAAGFEVGSSIIGSAQVLMAFENAGVGYGLIISTEAANRANTSVVNIPTYDVNYLYYIKNPSTDNLIIPSRGAINYNGTALPEIEDLSGHYNGINTEDNITFADNILYTTCADDTLLFTIGVQSRSTFVRAKAIGSSNSYLGLGRYFILPLSCIVDGNGEFVSDQDYTLILDTI